MKTLKRWNVLAVVAAGLALLLGSTAAAQLRPITRDVIIQRAQWAVGFGYWWGHGRWTSDGTGKSGTCYNNRTTACTTNADCLQNTCNAKQCSIDKKACTTTANCKVLWKCLPDSATPPVYKCEWQDGCGLCNYHAKDNSVPPKDVTCTTKNQNFCYGADCSGYVAKCWDVGSQTAVTWDEWVYGAGLWTADKPGVWKKIPRAQLQPGDALANSGHVVLYAGPPGNPKLAATQSSVYSASGCAKRINIYPNYPTSDLVPTCRLDLCDAPACDPLACSGHGHQVNGKCVCDQGYDGTKCEKCATGYSGYPNCVSDYNICTASAEIKCGQTLHGDTSSGSSTMQDYWPFCGNWTEDGKEVVYNFKPKANERVHASLTNMTGNVDVDLMILSGSCDNAACVEYGNTDAYFDTYAGQTYFISADDFAGSEGGFDLTLECDETAYGKWIGDVCNGSDSDCVFHWPDSPDIQLKCYSNKTAKFCSLDCTQYCPDMYGKAPSFCVEDPGNKGHGICVAEADSVYNLCCQTITGTTPQQMTRFNGTTSALVCMPK